MVSDTPLIELKPNLIPSSSIEKSWFDFSMCGGNNLILKIWNWGWDVLNLQHSLYNQPTSYIFNAQKEYGISVPSHRISNERLQWGS